MDWRGRGATLSNFFSRFAIFTLSLLIRIRKLAIPYWTSYRKLTGQFFGFPGEQIAGTEDFRANGGESYVLCRFAEFSRRLFPFRLRSSLGGYGMWMANVALFSVGHAVAFAVGASLRRAAVISLGTVYLISYYTELLRGPISEIRTQITDLQRAEAGIRRIRTMLETSSQLIDRGEERLPAGPLSVELEDVSFAYEPAGAAHGEEADAVPVCDLSIEIPISSCFTA